MTKPSSIDLNADVGEGTGNDAQLIPLVTSVNIACGAHAGGPEEMRAAVSLAYDFGASIGAHPGFADREHFGRKEIAVTPAEAAALVTSQVAALRAVARALGARVGHVKLHGALYNMASRDGALAAAVVEALCRDPERGQNPLSLVALSGSVLLQLGRKAGLTVIAEAFADRSYESDGSLTPRSKQGAVIGDAELAAAQALSIARDGRVKARGGAVVPVEAQTLCLHGDKPESVAFATRVRRELRMAGIRIKRPGA